MAKRSLVLSNDDGRVTFTNVDLINIEDSSSLTIRGHISASRLSVDALTSSAYGLTTNGTGSFVSASAAGTFARNGLVSSFNSGALGWNGITFVSTSIIPGDYFGFPAPNTDLSGNYEGDIKVINVSNVSSGSLKAAYGGTGLSGSAYASSNKLILKVSGSTNPVYSVLSASASGTIIASGEGRFHVQSPSWKPDVRFYGTPGTYTWTRPIGARFARIILQGAGGGGGGGRWNATSTSAFGGGGGASGGFTDITIDVSSLLSSSVVVGAGGAGGIGGAATVPVSTAGSVGGNTSWTDSNTTYQSAGGGGGGTASTTTRSIAGTGLTKDGGGGSATNSATFNVAETVYAMPSGGGKGVGLNTTSPARQLGGTIVPLLDPPNKNFGYNLDTTGATIITTFISGGAGSTAANIVGSNGSIGAGGGGGGASTTIASNGGRGGDGYALIISW